MKQGVTLYYVRHGQTSWNFERRIQGQTDIDLNDTGRAQAARNGNLLKDLRPDIAELDFVASPLNRCRETMEIVRECIGMPREGYATDDRIKEIHYGSWQGQLWPEIHEFDPQGAAAREADPFNWRPDGGESYADLTARAAAWSGEIERDTVVVSHGAFSRALRAHVVNLDHDGITELRVPQDKVLILRAGEMEWA